MDWLLEIIKVIFSSIFDLARRAVVRDKSRPRWFNHFLVGSYYLLPSLILSSVFISWKITLIAGGGLVGSLLAGAATEGDDIGSR